MPELNHGRVSSSTKIGSARVQKLFTIALIVHIYIRVFSISNTIFERLLKDEANIRKTTWKTLRGANATGAVRAFSMMQASA